jgi:hypothetical protein
MNALPPAFFLFAVSAFGAESPLKLELHDSPLAVTFTNTSPKPIRILKPLDGSEWCWIMPHYKLTVTTAEGQVIPMGPRCGLFGHPYSDTKWPDDYLVTIPPGGSHKQPLTAFHAIKATGTYNLQFHYIHKPDTDETPGGPYPPNLWRGETSSNTIKMRLERQP